MKDTRTTTGGRKLKVTVPFLIILAVGVFCVLIGYLYCVSVEKDLLQAINENGTRTLILLLAGIIGWYFLYRRTATAEQSTRIAEQVLTVERLNRAVEQLASDKPSVRLGGIRSLEQIADTQEEERIKIIQILVARIRELVKLKKKEETIIENTDIEIAFKALANIAKPLGKQKGKFFELSKVDLSGLSFTDIDLSYFPLADMVLIEVTFLKVNFTGANLKAATIDKITFDNCRGLTEKQIRESVWHQGCPRGLPAEWNLPAMNLFPQE